MPIRSGYDEGQRDTTRVDQQGAACFHFFPRSVGFGPTASRPKGAFTIVPSTLCQLQAMPSISSYSASPARQRARKNPCLSHIRK